MKNKTNMRLIFALVVISHLVLAQKAPTVDTKVKEFEAYVQKSQKEWEVPGLAVAIVKDGKVLHSKGYGVQELGTSKMVDSKTLFVCASTTKAMTAACMGMLVDEGKVKWDDRVVEHLPEFQLYDPFVTREIKIRDLFVHNTGLGNADFLWGIMDIPTDSILYKMRNVRPTYSLRGGFIYQNIFYVAAGKIIEKVSGKPWGTFISERIFQPLGMSRTVPFQRLATDPNRTKPHYKIEGAISVIEHTNADEIGPAGSVWSCADDIAKWMAAMIDSSKYTGGRLLSTRTWSEMFRPQVLASRTFYPTNQLTKPNWTTYGLGWYQLDYKGHKVNLHTGSLAGAIAIHAQLPDERFGIYVFGNLDHAEVRHALVYKAFDHFSLGGTRDWSADFKNLYGKISADEEKKEKEFEAKRVMNTRPTLTIDAYTGEYKDPLFGTLVVTRDGDNLVAVANNFARGTFSHWHYDTFRGWYDKKWYGKGNLSFVIGTDGQVALADFDGYQFRKIIKK
jgi:CubicO group peptidase (beta-lactamase class C family)